MFVISNHLRTDQRGRKQRQTKYHKCPEGTSDMYTEIRSKDKQLELLIIMYTAGETLWQWEHKKCKFHWKTFVHLVYVVTKRLWWSDDIVGVTQFGNKSRKYDHIITDCSHITTTRQIAIPTSGLLEKAIPFAELKWQNYISNSVKENIKYENELDFCRQKQRDERCIRKPPRCVSRRPSNPVYSLISVMTTHVPKCFVVNYEKPKKRQITPQNSDCEYSPGRQLLRKVGLLTPVNSLSATRMKCETAQSWRRARNVVWKSSKDFLNSQTTGAERPNDTVPKSETILDVLWRERKTGSDDRSNA